MTRALVSLLSFVLLAAPAAADPPADAVAIDAAEVLACISARYRGEALRIDPEDDGLVQEVRLLTAAGNVLEITLTGPGCRFLEVDGVGQTEARILPEDGQ